MSNYGADEFADMNKAVDLAYDQGFLPINRTNIMQWSYNGGIVVRKLANRQNGSNCLFKIQE